MAIVSKIGALSVKERSDMENALAEARANEAKIEYIAMMLDVDMEEDDEREVL